MPDGKTPEIPASRPLEIKSPPPSGSILETKLRDVAGHPVVADKPIEHALGEIKGKPANKLGPEQILSKTLDPEHPNIVNKPFEPSLEDVAKQVERMKHEEAARRSLIETAETVNQPESEADRVFEEAKRSGKLGELEVRAEEGRPRVVHIKDKEGEEIRWTKGQKERLVGNWDDFDFGGDEEEVREIMGEEVRDLVPAGGGGGGRDRVPPRDREEGNWPENEWSPESPERGRGLVDLIVEMRTTMDYEERYGIEENRRRIRNLYDSLQGFVDELITSGRNSPEDFGPQKAYRSPAQTPIGNQLLETTSESPDVPAEIAAMRAEAQAFLDQYQLDREELVANQLLSTEPLPDLTRDPTRSLEARRQQANESFDSAVVEAAEADLLNYFKHAKNLGLLGEVDVVLNSVYQNIISGRVPAEAVDELFNRGVTRALNFGGRSFRDRSRQDNIPQELSGVWQAYVEWASERIERAMVGVDQLPTREGEWSIEDATGASNRKETYWQVGAYPKLYVITAQSPDQFITAKETFLKMIKSGMLGRAPTANFEHVKNFIEEFSRAGGVQVERGDISVDFLEENRLELEALLYLLVSDYSKEVYNPKQAKEAALAMAMDEGPARWVRAYRAGKGKAAVFTHMFDYEEVMNIFNNSVGEQGELDEVAGHFMQDMIQEKVIERGMGMVLKDYDPRDQYFNLSDLGRKIEAAADLDRIKRDLLRIERDVSSGRIRLREGETALSRLSERDQSRLNAFTNNLNRLGLTSNTEEFKALYEGFDNGDYHINNYLAYREDQKLFAEDQAKPKDQRQYQRKYPEFSKLPANIKQSIELGEVQVLLKDLRQAVLKGEIKLEPGKTVKSLLNSRQRRIYQEAYDDALANFEIAFQMQNVMGEKARRGKGFLYVDRNPHIQYYYGISDEWRTSWIDKKRSKVLNTDTFTAHQIEMMLDPRKVGELARELLEDHHGGSHESHGPDTTEEDIARLVVRLKAKIPPRDKIDSFKAGWMIDRLRDGKRLDSFPQEWQDLYQGLSPEEKEDVVDNIPTYKMENFVQWAVTWTKMKYASATPKVRRQKVRDARARAIEELRTRGYSAQLWDDELEDGRPQLMRYKRPLGRIDQSTGQFKKFEEGEVLGYSVTGQEVKLRFNANGKPDAIPFDANGKIEVYDRDRQRINYDITRDTIARLDQGILVEEAVATFDFAASGNDFRSNYTVDTYNYYQGNDRVTAFKPEVLAGKDKIIRGISRPEDEDLLARRALVVDPTNRRTKKFSEVQKKREVGLVAAAVLESFQDRMRIRHALYKAFLPKDGYGPRMKAGYRNEDWAGMDRMTFGFVEMAAQQTERFARRMGAELAIMPFEHDSGPARWGMSGVTEGIKMMADNIKKVSKQALKGQFGLTKVFEAHDLAVLMYNAVVGYTDQNGKHVFGLAEKPTDNFEQLHQFVKKLTNFQLLHEPNEAIPYLYKDLETSGRLRTVTQLMRVIYTNNENGAGAVNLEDVEVFLPDGSYNVAGIDAARSVLAKNGLARNRQYAFLYGEEGWDKAGEGYYGWLQDKSPGGGSDVYSREAYWASLLSEEFSVFKGAIGEGPNGVEVPNYDHGGRVMDWKTDKII